MRWVLLAIIVSAIGVGGYFRQQSNAHRQRAEAVENELHAMEAEFRAEASAQARERDREKMRNEATRDALEKLRLSALHERESEEEEADQAREQAEVRSALAEQQETMKPEGASSSLRASQRKSVAELPPVTASIVYFYTDWCRYCKRFSQNVLASPELSKHSISVRRINPEENDDNAQLAEKHGVRGYPTLFVIDGATWKPISSSSTPAQFIASLRATQR